MKKRLLTILSMLVLGQLWAQTPVETFSFNNGNLNGENGTTATNSTITSAIIADANGNANSAIYINGSEQVIYNNIVLNPKNGISVSFWVKPSSNMTGNKVSAIFSQRTQCKAVHSIESFVNGSTNKISFTLRRTNGAVSVNTDYTPDVWQHFTFTFNATDGKMRVYKNGQYVGLGTNSVEQSNIPTSISGNFGIGYNPCVNVDGTLRYIGGLDELNIYDERLSELDVKLLWNPATDVKAYQDSVMTNSLVENYDFTNFVSDYAVGQNFVDNNALNSFSALQLDGSNTKNYISPTGTTNGYTISLWLKPDAFTGTKSQVITSQRSACTGVNSFEIYRNGTDIIFSTRTSAGGASVKVGYTPGEWSKFTFIADRSKNMLSAYKNGAFDNQSTGNGRIPSNLSTSTLRVGTSICVNKDGTPQYNGAIDELYIYQKNLTTQEITNAYTQNDNEQFSPAYSNKFDLAIQEELRPDPATNTNDEAIKLTGTVGVNLKSNAITTGGDGYTFSFWVKPDGNTTANNQVLFAKRDQCTWRDLFAANINGTSNKVSMELRTLDQEVISLGLDYTPDVWQQVAFVVDLNTFYLYGYVNGVKMDSVAITGHEVPGTYSSNVPLALSSSPCNHSKYVGGVDELKIYVAPLEEINVLALFDETQVITNVSNTEETEEFVIYPSPASSHVFVTPGSVQVIDLNGTVVIDTKTEGTLDVSALKTGMYIVCQDTRKAKLIIE